MEKNYINFICTSLIIIVVFNLLGASGEEWKTVDEKIISKHTILFPDGNGKVHKVSLAPPKGAVSRSWFEVKKPEFWLYTRRNREEPIRINNDHPETLKNSPFSSDLDTKIITHGWHSSRNSSICILLKDAFLETYDTNVIVVDWNTSAKKTYYFARKGLDKVAKYVGKFLDFLVTEGKISLDTVHLVGHSLGGHLIGLSSRRSNRGKPSRLTALDPALPLFSIQSSEHRLDKTDGKYLEVVHTSGGILGFMEPLGHADFYPNGGRSQPGCGLDPARVCAHMRSYDLYAEVIKNKGTFAARKCEDLEDVKSDFCDGDEIEWNDISKGSGLYYLETGSAAPFSME